MFLDEVLNALPLKVLLFWKIFCGLVNFKFIPYLSLQQIVKLFALVMSKPFLVHKGLKSPTNSNIALLPEAFL